MKRVYMISSVKKGKSQRKTFTLPNYMIEELEVYSREYDINQSQVIVRALEEFLSRKNNRIKRRLDALDALTNIAHKGSLKDLSLKKVRAEKALNA